MLDVQQTPAVVANTTQSGTKTKLEGSRMELRGTGPREEPEFLPRRDQEEITRSPDPWVLGKDGGKAENGYPQRDLEEVYKESDPGRKAGRNPDETRFPKDRRS